MAIFACIELKNILPIMILIAVGFIANKLLMPAIAALFTRKYLLNHSFMIPGLLGVGTSTVVAYAISRIIL